MLTSSLICKWFSKNCIVIRGEYLIRTSALMFGFNFPGEYVYCDKDEGGEFKASDSPGLERAMERLPVGS